MNQPLNAEQWRIYTTCAARETPQNAPQPVTQQHYDQMTPILKKFYREYGVPDANYLSLEDQTEMIWGDLMREEIQKGTRRIVRREVARGLIGGICSGIFTVVVGTAIGLIVADKFSKK